MKRLLVLLAACKASDKPDDQPTITPARPLELACELGKPGEPPPGLPVAFAGKRVWLYATDALTVTGEHGLMAAIPVPFKHPAAIGAAAVTRGLAIIARGDNRWWLAQLDASGAPRGVPIAIAGIAPEVGRIDVAGFADTVVLELQSSRGAQLQELGLDGVLVGAPLELGAVGLDDFARIGQSHAFALRYREHSNEPAKLRIFDGDQRAWAGPPIAIPFDSVAGVAPFGDALLVVGKLRDALVAATLDASGALSAAKTLTTAEAMFAAAPIRGADDAHAFAVWTTDQTVHVAQILPDLRLGRALAFQGDPGDRPTASDTAIYAGGQRFTCR